MIGVLLALILSGTADAREPQGRPPRDSTTVFHSTLQVGMWVWSAGISPGDGPRCPLYPSCSAFARQAVRREGLAAVALAADRLVREPFALAGPLHTDGTHHVDLLADHPPFVPLVFGGRCRARRRAGADVCL